MALFSVIVTSLASCSKDEGEIESGTLTDFKINDTKISKLLTANCEEGHLMGEYWVSFGSQFYYEDDMVYMEVSVPFKSFSQLKSGQELIDYIDIAGFYVLLGPNNSNIGFGGSSARYNDLEGSVKVKSLNNKTVTLQFSNFSFNKSQGDEKKFVFSGSITYNFN